MEIRKLPTDRWRDYRRLRLEALKLSPLAFGDAFEEEASSGERTWRRYMKRVSFAMHKDEPVGMIVCAFNNGVKFRHIAEIYSFYVRPGYRREGIGRALLDHSIETAKKDKRIIKVRLYVNSCQRTAVRMYEKAGFVVTARLEREMKVGRRLHHAGHGEGSEVTTSLSSLAQSTLCPSSYRPV